MNHSFPLKMIMILSYNNQHTIISLSHRLYFVETFPFMAWLGLEMRNSQYLYYIVFLFQADGDDKNVARLEGGKEFLKQEFVNAAYQSFLAGKDPGLDYAQVLVS